ncbi:pre-mRNA-splicing factor ATP-dependent RNA helicase DEAH1, partial [Dendrobium catenatum]|uniref:pre-mRNA-splicing factor ATP-dependent RNA helicase DEAH1 n=1 Tax=Dendrobium catenatum TaxID=906689 RepID=UPI00109FB4ED
MADEVYLKSWVSDKLMSLMGYSKSLVVQYVIRLSKESSSPTELVGKLVEYGLSSSKDTRLFAEEIFAKVPHKPSGLSSYLKEEREAIQLAKKQLSYKLLDSDDEDDRDDQASMGGASHASTKGNDHRKRFRKSHGSHGDDDDEAIELDKERQVRSRLSPENYDLESEEAMICDQEERLQLERNMREKDAARTRKATESKLTKKQEEEIMQRAKALEENDIADLRKVSRQVYLQKRRDQKLLEIRDDI